MFRSRKKIHPDGKLTKKKKLFLILFLCVIINFLLFGYLLNFNLLKVLEIKVETKDSSCLTKEQIEKEVLDYKLNLLNLNSENLKNKIKKKYLCIKNVEEKITLPKSFVIKIEDRIPLALVNSLEFATSSSEIDTDNLFISTQSGVLNLTTNNFNVKKILVLDDSYFFYADKNDLAQLPKLNLVKEEISLNSKAKEIITAGVDVLIQLKQLNIPVLENILFKDIFVLSSSDGKKIIFKLKKDVNIQIAKLQIILQKANMDDKKISHIDLRFDKPVVVYAKGDK